MKLHQGNNIGDMKYTYSLYILICFQKKASQRVVIKFFVSEKMEAIKCPFVHEK